MHSFPRPSELHLSVERRPAQGACPECGAAELADYRVLGEGLAVDTDATGRLRSER